MNSNTDHTMHRLYSAATLLTTLVVGLHSGDATAQDAATEFQRGTIDIGVVVSDLPLSLAFYTEVLGMHRAGEFTIDEDFGRRSGLTGGEVLHVAVLKLDDGEDSTSWKLMSYDGATSNAPHDHIQDGLGVRYITIQVKDLHPFLSRLRDRQIPLLGETPIALGDTQEFVLVKDPDGIFVELIGPKSD